MFGWFKKSPEQKLQNQIEVRYATALQLQRNGKLREYAAIMAEINELEEQLVALNNPSA